MTNDDSPNKNRDGAVLETQTTPEHRTGFWSELESAMTNDGNESPSAPRTEELRVAPAGPRSPVDELAARRNRRRIWPMAAAAAVLALVGIGFLATRSGTNPGLSTDVVAGTPGAADIVPLDGPEDESADSDADTDTSDRPDPDATDPDAAPASGSATADAADTDGDSERADSGAAVDPTPAAAPLPAFESAIGATGEPDFFPIEGGLPSGSTFLANSAQYSVTWWTVADGDCNDTQYSTIRTVNGSLQVFVDRRTEAFAVADQALAERDAFVRQLPVLERGVEFPPADLDELTRLNGELLAAGIALEEADQLLDVSRRQNQGVTQDAFEPNRAFSGDISHFTTANDMVAWLVSCGPQIELWVGSIVSGGRLDDARMVWFGPGQSKNAFMLWVEDEVSLSLLGTDGTPFSIEYDTVEQAVTRNGRPTRFQQESGAIEHRTTPVAASADGGLSYWPGISDQGEGACSGSFGRADTLWLRRVTTEAIPVWQPALADDTRLGQVTAMAVEDEFSQVAFADVCPDQVGRVFLATQRADGQLSNLREIDLSPYVPGFADALYWVDSETLRIETDNSQYSVDAVRFDFRLDDGRENGVIVQLD